MMTFVKPSEVIKRIRAIIPSFADRVAGAAQFDAIEDIARIDLPACFVMLTDSNADTVSIQTQLKQDIYHGMDVLVVLDAVDIRKQEAEEVMVGFKEILIYALNGWLPDNADTSGSPLRFVGDIWRSTDRARYMRIFRFIQDYTWNQGDDGSNEDDTLGNFDTFISSVVEPEGAEGKTLPIEIHDMYVE